MASFNAERFYLLLVISSITWPCMISVAIVTHLPGFPGALPFRLETGYVNVNEVKQASLFYYFIESERNASEDPLVLWLTGGPGCSSFYGLVREIGPIRFKEVPYDGTLPTLISNPYAWTKFVSIIFLDWPTGTGFSFSRNVTYYNADDTKSSKQICKFINQWFLDHPHFLSNPFYVGGNSYGGKMSPIVTRLVSQGIEEGQHPLINLKGYLAGNPQTGDVSDRNSRVSYAHGVGIISDELFESIQRSCAGEDHRNPRSIWCIEQIKIFNGFVDELMLDNILAPKCLVESPKPNMVKQEGDRYLLEEKPTELLIPPPVPDIKCTTYASYLAYHWANANVTRKALHVVEGTVKEWQICNHDMFYSYMAIDSSIPYHLDLITKGYRALIYSGDHDLGMPYVGTMEWINPLNLSILESWRSWHVDGQVGGYTVRYSNNLTFATVKGGGHEPSKERNKETSTMFYRWISHKPL
ncbi:hypothetical protein HPP92_027947 [Vanilla planifolia]|uniref:Uncharacterized protein n=1 Tax=Vanilla planifolia TaxID=51239 RepID=A0A835U588_VANPL|nr:hypothetical protein HPP92_027947 [Vanilla planifolia]KAG0448330.1 hypothetical protein HPP92_027898 [Vanilla planifolia]